jgi:hypothetical protein
MDPNLLFENQEEDIDEVAKAIKGFSKVSRKITSVTFANLCLI